MSRYICDCEELALPRHKYCEPCDQYKKLEAERDCLLFELELTAAHEREACVSIITREAQAYSEPVWAVEIVNDIRARGKK